MSHISTDQRTRHVASRMEDKFHGWRANRAQAKGHVAVILPYTGYGSTGPEGGWIRVLARVVLAGPGAFEFGQQQAQVIADGIRGFRNFISPILPFAKVSIDVGEQRFVVQADRGGVVDVKLAVDLPAGWQEVHLHAHGGDQATARIMVIDQSQKFGVISDVDDTVVVTALPRPLLAAWNSFVLSEHARVATPGMAVMLQKVRQYHPRGPMIYLSTGAWNVTQTLQRFMSRNLYPEGPLLLTDWGPTERSWFRSGMQHKVDQLRRLAQEFPQISWILVGDDGQHDPAIYAEFARRYPELVRAIVIRQLTPSEAVLAGGRSNELRRTTPGVHWIYEPDGARILDQLVKLGLVNDDAKYM
ncbi:App1 family protein [Glutamicibacter sp. JC586]|uniref:App1 family protein n=1 Tax=Glutamicibacter sp. JC586 TaxID=2590552 RepID=UPI00135A7533|nr:phosphatase domain-containing protein [Glutamicibacter sp. JC586]